MVSSSQYRHGGRDCICGPSRVGCLRACHFSPILFNIYLKALDEVIHQFEVQYHHYADGTQLYISILSDIGEAVNALIQYLQAVWVWMGENRVWLNPNKAATVWTSCFGDVTIFDLG